MNQQKTRYWWPFISGEVELGLGVFGFVAGGLGYLGVPSEMLWRLSLAFLMTFYLAGLYVRARAEATKCQLVMGGGVGGEGHVEVFKAAKRCLFLTHVDDDPPSDELLLLYNRLLERGIEIRRIIFVRKDARVDAYAWLSAFGDHERLLQRVVVPDEQTAPRFSVAVVDDEVVLLSVPGWEAIDGKPYAAHLVLRHLLRIEDRVIAAVFLKMHEDMWERALPLRSAAELKDWERLAKGAESGAA